MNLYQIDIQHIAPKDTRKAIVGYIVANNDEEVYSYLANDPELNGENIITCWRDREEEEEKFDVYDDEYNVIGEESFKEKIIRIKGEMNDEDYDYSDAYYGITLYGWTLVKENVTEEEVKSSIALGIVTRI